MRIRKNKSWIVLVIIVAAFAIIAMNLTSCSAFEAGLARLKGELIGTDYTVKQYDNFGNHVLTVEGTKVALSADLDEYGEPVNSYIDIAIDGYEWNHVGGTLVFAQNGVDMITDFTMPEEIPSFGVSTGLITIDRNINYYQNLFGKELIVVVSSQNGTPIGLFQGNDCYVEIPTDLPKTTMIYIDGKMVYVHRANIDIMDADMFLAGK